MVGAHVFGNEWAVQSPTLTGYEKKGWDKQEGEVKWSCKSRQDQLKQRSCGCTGGDLGKFWSGDGRG